MEDRIAISRLKQGDLTGLESLVSRYQVQAVHAAYLIVYDRALAEDMVRTAFVKVAEYVGDRARVGLAQKRLPDADGWVTLELPFESFIAARTGLLGLGRAVEVLEPESLRRSLIDFAQQIVGFYETCGVRQLTDPTTPIP